MSRNRDLTKGSITTGLWAFAVPLMLGNILQQLYNLIDTWVVGRYIGDNALAAVGSSYTLMTFLTSIIIGLCLGSGSFLSMAFGRKDEFAIRNGIFMSFVLIGAMAIVIMGIVYGTLDFIISLLQVPEEIMDDMHIYMFYVMLGFTAIFLYNYVANVLRAVGNSIIALIFLGISVVLNIFLDFYFVAMLGWGISGAAIATVIAQHISGIGLCIYFFHSYPMYRIKRKDMVWRADNLKKIMSLSGFTCLQQSVMNFGILIVQGIVNSFGTTVMAGFAVAVKIDTIAYMPVQDFGNAFSVFVAQNFGADKRERISEGIRQALVSVVLFCLAISGIVFISAKALMTIFVGVENFDVINVGATYLRIEGAFYLGIGILFLLYGYYRAVNKPGMSVILTIISLGTRVVLGYALSRIPSLGEIGIWLAIPIGWILADAVGITCYIRHEKGR